MGEVEYNDEADLADMVICPVERLDRAGIKSIPLGAHMLLANIKPDGVEFSGSRFTEREREQWLDGLDGEDDCYESSSAFYIHPERISDAPRLALSMDEVLRQAAHAMGKEFEEPPAEVKDFLMHVIRLSRQGMVENPF